MQAERGADKADAAKCRAADRPCCIFLEAAVQLVAPSSQEDREGERGRTWTE